MMINWWICSFFFSWKSMWTWFVPSAKNPDRWGLYYYTQFMAEILDWDYEVSVSVCLFVYVYMGLPQWLSGKESTCHAGDGGSIPGSGRSPGGGYGNPLQYSCLGNPMDREAWWATVHGLIQIQTWLSMQARTHGLGEEEMGQTFWDQKTAHSLSRAGKAKSECCREWGISASAQ